MTGVEKLLDAFGIRQISWIVRVYIILLLINVRLLVGCLHMIPEFRQQYTN